MSVWAEGATDESKVDSEETDGEEAAEAGEGEREELGFDMF